MNGRTFDGDAAVGDSAVTDTARPPPTGGDAWPGRTRPSSVAAACDTEVRCGSGGSDDDAVVAVAECGDEWKPNGETVAATGEKAAEA